MSDWRQMRLEVLNDLGIPSDAYLYPHERAAVRRELGKRRRAAKRADRDKWERRALGISDEQHARYLELMAERIAERTATSDE